jgi:hypothetical protein
MWGTTPPCAKLTGDAGNGFEATLIGDFRSFRPLAENQPQCLLGLLQQYLPTGDMEFASINERGRQLRRPYFFGVGLSVAFWASKIAKQRSELAIKDRDR